MAEDGAVVHGRLFGLPAWAAILTLGAAGVIGYLLFFRQAKKPGYGTTGYSPYALAVMQNPDESATMAEQNRLLSVIGVDVTNGFSSVGTSLNTMGGQIGQGFAGVHDQVANNTYMNYYNAAYYYGLQQASQTSDPALKQGWTDFANQFKQAIEQGRAGGMGVQQAANAPYYYGQQPAAA